MTWRGPTVGINWLPGCLYVLMAVLRLAAVIIGVAFRLLLALLG